MVKVLLYAQCVGVRSSRKIAKRFEEDVAFRVLAAGNAPSFRTAAEFRSRHLNELAGLFAQVLTVCGNSGLVSLKHAALDGTKIKANASKHKAMSYGRMKETRARLEKRIKERLRDNARLDEAEDRKFGSDKRGDELPEDLVIREKRLAKIKEAMAALEEESARGEREAALCGRWAARAANRNPVRDQARPQAEGSAGDSQGQSAAKLHRPRFSDNEELG